MDVIPAAVNKILTAGGIGARWFFAPEPGIIGFGAIGFGATVFVLEFQGNHAEKAGAAFVNVSSQEKGTDILADAVVDIQVPALGLFLDRLPADEDIKWFFAFENGGKLGLERTSSSKAISGSGFVGLGVVGLLLNPVAEVTVCQFLQGGVVKPVVVDQGVEAIGPAIPDVPDKRPIVEEFGVLLEKLVSQPAFQGFGFTALEHGSSDNGTFIEGAKGGGMKHAQSDDRRLLAAERRQTDDAVFIGEGFQPIRSESLAIGKAAAGLARPTEMGYSGGEVYRT
jgi:hypothetical protein